MSVNGQPARSERARCSLWKVTAAIAGVFGALVLAYLADRPAPPGQRDASTAPVTVSALDQP